LNPVHFTFIVSLSKDRLYSFAPAEKVRCFDKLSTNGIGVNR
jgi:Holliday junction resolvasome RuvABC DNA-binding subunit